MHPHSNRWIYHRCECRERRVPRGNVCGARGLWNRRCMLRIGWYREQYELTRCRLPVTVSSRLLLLRPMWHLLHRRVECVGSCKSRVLSLGCLGSNKVCSIREFTPLNFPIYMYDSKGDYKVMTMNEVSLPFQRKCSRSLKGKSVASRFFRTWSFEVDREGSRSNSYIFFSWIYQMLHLKIQNLATKTCTPIKLLLHRQYHRFPTTHPHPQWHGRNHRVGQQRNHASSRVVGPSWTTRLRSGTDFGPKVAQIAQRQQHPR